MDTEACSLGLAAGLLYNQIKNELSDLTQLTGAQKETGAQSELLVQNGG